MGRERVTLTASQRLIEVLSKIRHAISKNLIEDVRYRGSSVVSYLDMCEANDCISFIYSNKMSELHSECDHNDITFKEKVWSSKRAEMRIGKLVRLIYGDRFPINMPRGEATPSEPYDIESFVNMYKAEMSNTGSYENFEIVQGNDIVFWYNQANYTKFVNEDTPLGKSCLRYAESGKFLEMFVKNTEKIKMVIFKDGEGKLKGRALLWDLEKPNRTYMDRIYTVNDFDVEVFKKYAKENEWLYKERQTYGWNNRIIDGKDGKVYPQSEMIMSVVLSHDSLRYHPYLDTMSVYNRDTKEISNNGKLLRKPPHIQLSDYQGNFFDNAEYRDLVYSAHYDEEILQEEAKYCEVNDDWVYERDAVYINNCNGHYGIAGSDIVVKSNIYGNIKYFLKEKCTYSKYLDTWFYTTSIRTAFTSYRKTEEIIIHRKMVDFFSEGAYGNLYLKSFESHSNSEQKDIINEFGDYKSYVLNCLVKEEDEQKEESPYGYTFEEAPEGVRVTGVQGMYGTFGMSNGNANNGRIYGDDLFNDMSDDGGESLESPEPVEPRRRSPRPERSLVDAFMTFSGQSVSRTPSSREGREDRAERPNRADDIIDRAMDGTLDDPIEDIVRSAERRERESRRLRGEVTRIRESYGLNDPIESTTDRLINGIVNSRREERDRRDERNRIDAERIRRDERDRIQEERSRPMPDRPLSERGRVRPNGDEVLSDRERGHTNPVPDRPSVSNRLDMTSFTDHEREFFERVLNGNLGIPSSRLNRPSDEVSPNDDVSTTGNEVDPDSNQNGTRDSDQGTSGLGNFFELPERYRSPFTRRRRSGDDGAQNRED